VCSNDNGLTYVAAGCRYNNSTTRVHEVMGIVPPEWDNLVGFDLDPREGRVTREAFVTVAVDGDLQLLGFCPPGMQCITLKYVSAFVGRWGSGITLLPREVSVFADGNLPERDIYFCGGVVCQAGDQNAEPSGWIGPNN
jgi:hypothetical protein